MPRTAAEIEYDDEALPNQMKAKELYRELESALKPWMTNHGFKKQRASRLLFQKVVGDIYHTVWFQCDKWGWDPLAGGKFFVNFTVSESRDPESGARRDERLNYFLTDAELVFARDFRDAIVGRIPKPPESYFETLQAQWGKYAASAAELAETVRSEFEPETMPYRRNHDFTLRYWQARDVRGWAALVESVLPRAVDQMQSWSLPPYPAKRADR
ncbi:MAG: hypothetical protein M3P00_01580 [Gemmatimonadota bacterium]|nr:hypothetical protein [Gemmatimonadota bacterium]